jgi:hypothetical protein
MITDNPGGVTNAAMTRDTYVFVAIESFYVLSTGVFKASLGFFFLRIIVYRRVR